MSYKIKLYVVDANIVDFNALTKNKYIKDIDIKNALKYMNKDDQILHLISSFLKRKYIGNIFYNEFNKPLSDMIFFNISHTKQIVLLTISDKYNVGVDVERVTKISDKEKEYICCEEENQMIKNDIDFFKVWTSKESIVKCEGKGLNKIKEIPSIYSSKNTYNDIFFRTKTFVKNDYVISVTIDKDIDFEIEMIEEGLEND